MTDLRYPSRTRRLGSLLVFAAVCCAIGGCGSGSDSSNPNAGQTGKPNGPASAPAQSGSAAPIDACALLSAQDISTVLGTTVAGQATSTDPEVPGCKWENPSTYESVSLEIGNPGTAQHNTLPPPDPGSPDVGTPGPDGMRYLGGGQVVFAAGNRSNTVQVAVLRMSSDEANAAAVDLARKVAPQIHS
jgi:hypothetical protein